MSDWADLHGGVGLGSQGIQLEAGVRGRAPTSRFSALTLGASWSTGPFVAVAPEAALLGLPNMTKQSPPMRYFTRAHFANVDVGFETAHKGFRARPFFGLAVVVDPGDGMLVNAACDSRACPMNHLIISPYFGAACALPIL
jgi:hypothetical protein